MSSQNDFLRVAAVNFKVSPGDLKANLESIKSQLDHSENEAVGLTVFPELCLTGYTCQDLFLTQEMEEATISSLQEILSFF